MALLALDASTEACAVGIQTTTGELFQEFEIAPRKHTQLLPKMLDSVLATSGISKQEIKGCIVGVGPGAFTGIRIGMAMVQGIALGLKIPCFTVSSLHAIAQQAVLEKPNLTGSILATIDARMQEIYYGYYAVQQDKSTHSQSPEALAGNQQFQIASSCTTIVGTGVNCIEEQLNHHDANVVMNDCYPTAQSLIHIYQQHDLPVVAPEHIQASYIRNQVVQQT